jgi:hypothetical protein
LEKSPGFYLDLVPQEKPQKAAQRTKSHQTDKNSQKNEFPITKNVFLDVCV